MTFKSVVNHLVQDKAFTAFKKLMDESGIEYWYISPEDVEFEKYKNIHYYWSMNAEVQFNRNHSCVYKIGGTVDDLIGICVSCIHKNNELVWLFNPESREKLGIKKFEI